MNDEQIIEALGGTSAVAKLCEVTLPSVSEWKQKGIPRARRMYLQVIRPEVFEAIANPSASNDADPGDEAA